MLKAIIKKVLNSFSYEIRKKDPTCAPDGTPYDLSEDTDFLKYYHLCRNYSTCSIEPMYALYQAVAYIVKNNIEGDFVECGVYKGGSAMMMAYALQHFKCTQKRRIFLYDTFEGMSAPTEADADFKGQKAETLLRKGPKETHKIWCYSPLEEVQKNMSLTNYDPASLVYVKGKVEDTIPATLPQKISLLRLDTDWYASTKHELEHLYPLLVANGVIIIDDYGHWQGVRKATDDYFAKTNQNIFLNRIDYTVRVGIKNLKK